MYTLAIGKLTVLTASLWLQALPEQKAKQESPATLVSQVQQVWAPDHTRHPIMCQTPSFISETPTG